jgi:hypothetical protein
MIIARDAGYSRQVTNSTDPTVLWRMSRGKATAHATIFPGDHDATVTWFFNGVMDRAEKYDSIDLALARAEQIRGILVKDGWKE